MKQSHCDIVGVRKKRWLLKWIKINWLSSSNPLTCNKPWNCRLNKLKIKLQTRITIGKFSTSNRYVYSKKGNRSWNIWLSICITGPEDWKKICTKIHWLRWWEWSRPRIQGCCEGNRNHANTLLNQLLGIAQNLRYISLH